MTALSHTVAALMLLACLASCSTVSMQARFDRYCQTAGLEVKQRLSGPQRVLLDRSEVVRPEHVKRNPFSLFDFVRARNVDYVDERTESGTRYRRYKKSVYSPEIVKDTDANVLIKIEPLTTEADNDVDLYGQMMSISERPSGRLIATYRYFWTVAQGRLQDYCPKAKADLLDVSAIALYIIGARGDGPDKYQLDTYLPSPR